MKFRRHLLHAASFLSWTLGVLLPEQMLCAESQSNTRRVYMLPTNCSELIPDPSPFIEFLRTVALGSVASDRKLSKRLLKVLSLEERVAKLGREPNPVDTLIRRTLCYYREQKQQLGPVTFDDPTFIAYLRTAVGELESKVNDAIYDVRWELEQRKAFEKHLEQNRATLNALEREAEKEAENSYDRISSSAKRKARIP